MKKNTTKSRGATYNPDNRFASEHSEEIDDGWGILEEDQLPIPRILHIDNSKTVITYNQSPDIPFDRSINPYRGCEHGCIYCYARPSHAWLGLSPGLDFESQIFYKPDAARLLRQELAKSSYQCAPIALGPNTDSYQPVEIKLTLTRQIIEVLHETQHPVSIVTKSALIERDIDLLASMAEDQLVHIFITLTTLDRELSRLLEPRSAVPQRRLETIRRLTNAGITTGVLIAPLIPVLTDHGIEHIVAAVADAGAKTVGTIFLRLPLEVSPLFRDWLITHYPGQARHVISQIQQAKGGKDNISEFGKRMRGTGAYAQMLEQRFKLAMLKNAFTGLPPFRTDLFKKPLIKGSQMGLF